MPDDDKDEAQRLCHEVLVRYLTAVDHHRATQVLSVFADDAEIVARGQLLRGGAEIAKFLAEREADTERRTAHLIVNEVFDRLDESRAELTARVVLLLFQEVGGYRVDQVVETRQTFQRSGHEWRITHRDEAPLHPSGG